MTIYCGHARANIHTSTRARARKSTRFVPSLETGSHFCEEWPTSVLPNPQASAIHQQSAGADQCNHWRTTAIHSVTLLARKAHALASDMKPQHGTWCTHLGEAPLHVDLIHLHRRSNLKSVTDVLAEALTRSRVRNRCTNRGEKSAVDSGRRQSCHGHMADVLRPGAQADRHGDAVHVTSERC